MLPSALARSESFRSVHVGRSRFSRCCHLFGDLSFHSRVERGPRRLTQSPELGFGLLSFSSWNVFDFGFAFSYAVAATVIRLLLCNGTYTSPLTQRCCSNTASFLAVATMARFFAFLPPRSASFSPQRLRSQSIPNGPKICCAPCTNRVRRYGSPSLLMCICGSLCPEFLRPGCSPKKQPTSRLLRKRCASSSVSKNVSAISVPTPFTCFSSATCAAAWH